MIRRASYTGGSMGGSSQEPLIVVEESGGLLEEDEGDEDGAPPDTPRSGTDSLHLNPFLLSPYRDMRKRSLPTPQCTTGITASQVRRLSEQGGAEGKGPSPMEAAFLATLSQAPAPQAGGRRHSVVTISRAPPSSVIFGRNRRESIAAFGRGLPRRDSNSSMTGSNFNLQLDIMDNIAEIKAARKVRLKMWQEGEGQDKVCEVQPLEGGPSSRYHQYPGTSRRFSDVTGISAVPPPIPPRRRASEMPQLPSRVSTPPPSTSGKGIVCSNTDLISMLSSLTSSAQEIHNLCKIEASKQSLDMKRSRLKESRSNSFDISLLPDSKGMTSSKGGNEASNWFIRRHQPMANKKCSGDDDKKVKAMVTFADEKLKTVLAERKKDEEVKNKSDAKLLAEKVVWDKPSGSVVDPKVIGSAIEEYLNQKGSEAGTPTVVKDEPTPATPSKTTKTSWFGSSSKNKQAEEEGATASCDNSICSTLKDLFVK